MFEFNNELILLLVFNFMFFGKILHENQSEESITKAPFIGVTHILCSMIRHVICSKFHIGIVQREIISFILLH